ncbi:MAG: cell division protein ZapA [Desulfuromonadales bacterium]|nr:cell division protein ZapA [Desulfuromonadales bacterium]MBN2793164.1 cell division protein ZapA [Desulfuromonadales bacterium]
MSSNIHIKIQGREYSLRSHQSEKQTQRVVSFVEQKLAETADGLAVDTRDLTVLTLLNLAGQYLQLQDDQELKEEVRLQSLIDRVERAVDDNSGC